MSKYNTLPLLKPMAAHHGEIVNNYRSRLLVDNTIYRYKTIIGRKLNSRNFDNQKNEIAIACNILNKIFQLGMPVSKPA